MFIDLERNVEVGSNESDITLDYDSKELTKTYDKMLNSKSEDSIFKVYRKTKTWLEQHYFIANYCNHVRYTELKIKLRAMKDNALYRLECDKIKL